MLSAETNSLSKETLLYTKLQYSEYKPADNNRTVTICRSLYSFTMQIHRFQKTGESDIESHWLQGSTNHSREILKNKQLQMSF